jgi:hypothetical protein
MIYFCCCDSKIGSKLIIIKTVFSASSSGRSSLMSMVLTPPVLMPEHPIFNLSVSMFTTMKHQEEASMCPAQSWSIWSPVPWIPFALDLLANSFALTTLSLANLELATTGPRVTTPKVLSLLNLSWMWSVRKVNHVIAFRAFNLPTHWEVELAPDWEHC